MPGGPEVMANVRTLMSYLRPAIKVSWYKGLWMGSHLMSLQIIFNLSDEKWMCWARCLWGRGICLASWLKSFLFLVYIG